MSNYFNPSGVDFDNIFEPDANGPIANGFFRPDGSPLRYAPLANGSAAAGVYYYTDYGADLAALWAAKGTVPYTVPSLGPLGSWERPFHMNGSYGFSAGKRLSSWLKFTVRRNGMWDIVHYSTNFENDKNIQTLGGQPFVNYPETKVMQSGAWAQRPEATVGDGYTLSIGMATFEWGRVDYPVVPPTVWTVQPNNAVGVMSTNDGTYAGLGNDMWLAADREFMIALDQTMLQTGPLDKNSGLSRYNRCILNCYIKRNGVVVLSFQVYLNNENRFAHNKYYAGGSSGGGGGGGGTGGGGCITTDMYMDKERLAYQIQIGDWVDGSTYDPDGMTPRQVRQNRVMVQPCYRMVTESGIAIIASDSTPMTLRTGGSAMFGPDMIGQDVFVDDRGELRWERVTSVTYVGFRNVVLFNVDDQSYFAGEAGDRRIATHNAVNVKD